MARIRALRNSQVPPSPAAASIENNMPADVGAAKRPASNVSFQAAKLPQTSGGKSTNTKYSVTKNHGKLAAVKATR